MKKLIFLVLVLAVLAGVAAANLGERRVYPLRPGIKYLFTGSLDPNNWWDDVNDVYILNGCLEVLDINITGDLDVNDMNIVGDLTLEALTASRLLYLDADSNVASVADLTDWIAGTANQIIATDPDTDGTVTLSLPQDYDTGATPTLGGLTITGNSVFGLNSSVFQPATDSTTFFQILDADGGTPIFNVDSTNERVGILTTSPDTKLQVVGTAGFGDDADNETLFASDGFQTMAGSARVTNEIILNASSIRIPTTNPAALGEIQIAGSTIYTPVYEFDPTGAGADEQLFISEHMPEYIDGSINLTVHLVWQPDDGDGGTDNYEWNIDYIVTKDGDFDYTAGSATTITEDITPSDAVTVLHTSFTDTVDVDDDQMFWARLWLDKSDSGADDDGNVLFVELVFVQNKLGEPLGESYLLLQTGDYFLLQNGDKLILQGS